MLENLIEAPALKHVFDALTAHSGDSILESAWVKQELSLKIRKDALPEVLSFLKSEHGFTSLNDIIALDRSGPGGSGTKRFSLLYQLYQFSGKIRLRVKVDIDENEIVESITSIYKSADWAEREIFDMFGIRFSGHPDLRRIYMPDEFSGHPLRKDFPLEGKEPWLSKK